MRSFEGPRRYQQAVSVIGTSRREWKQVPLGSVAEITEVGWKDRMRYRVCSYVSM